MLEYWNIGKNERWEKWNIGILGKKIGKTGKKKWCLIYAFIFLLNPLFQYSIIPI